MTAVVILFFAVVICLSPVLGTCLLISHYRYLAKKKRALETEEENDISNREYEQENNPGDLEYVPEHPASARPPPIPPNLASSPPPIPADAAPPNPKPANPWLNHTLPPGVKPWTGFTNRQVYNMG